MLDFHKRLKTFKAPRSEDQEPVSFMAGFAGSLQIKPYQRDVLDDVEIIRFSFEAPTVTREG